MAPVPESDVSAYGDAQVSRFFLFILLILPMLGVSQVIGPPVEWVVPDPVAETLEEMRKRDCGTADFVLTEKEVRAVLIKACETLDREVRESEIKAMTHLAWRESSYKPRVKNKISSAWGLWQFMDKTWATAGIAYRTPCPERQAVGALNRVDNHQTYRGMGERALQSSLTRGSW